MKKTTVLGIIGAALVFSSAACFIPLYLPDSGDNPPRNEFHQVIALDPGGSISLDNASGDIEIRGWDKNEVEITAEDDWNRAYGRRSWFSGRGGTSGPKVVVDTGSYSGQVVQGQMWVYDRLGAYLTTLVPLTNVT